MALMHLYVCILCCTERGLPLLCFVPQATAYLYLHAQSILFSLVEVQVCPGIFMDNSHGQRVRHASSVALPACHSQIAIVNLSRVNECEVLRRACVHLSVTLYRSRWRNNLAKAAVN